MTDHSRPDFGSVRERLGNAGIDFETLDLARDWSIIVTRFGGRILGPFKGQDGGSLLWLNEAFSDDGRFARVVDGSVPMGGERVWISPEVQYGCTDRTRFWDTLFVPAAVDPGNYDLERPDASSVRLFQRMELEAYNLVRGSKRLSLERLIDPVTNPIDIPGTQRPGNARVDYCGYRHTTRLSEDSRDAIHSEAWSLAQVYPGGTLLFPTVGRPVTADYFEPAPPSLVQANASGLTCRITGDTRYKIGVHRLSSLGRILYRQPFDETRDLLMVRIYPNDPTGRYADEPPAERGVNGFSCHMYNDDGKLGGFGEIETMGSPIGGSNGTSEALDRTLMLFYLGDRNEIDSVEQRFVPCRTAVRPPV